MGDSACLMHGFSYASAIPNNDSKNGNPMQHALGESVSFGRFTAESLSWEKWSTFSHKKYVEEAERYSQPGSVAEKKAFFEAHYKQIAAKKAAAALLDQQNAAQLLQPQQEFADNNNISAYDQSYVDVKMDVDEIGEEGGISVTPLNEASSENPVNENSVNRLDNLENNDTVSCSRSSGTTIMERALLKNSVASQNIPIPPSLTCTKISGFSTMKSPIQSKTWEIQSTPAKTVTPHLNKENSNNRSTSKSRLESFDKKRSSQNSLRALMNLLPNNEPDKDPNFATKKAEKLGIALGIPQQDCVTTVSTNSVSTNPAAAPQSENKRIKTPLDPSVRGSKTGPKWHILSAVCSKPLKARRNKLQSPALSSSSSILQTEERASMRKQGKSGNENSKLGCSFCFKARPSLDYYKERETPVKSHEKRFQQDNLGQQY
ncbi:hypothetical protein ABFX02_08G005100 [Erythranthe guttata]